MNQLELIDRKNQLQEQLKAMIGQAESETRKLSEEEQRQYDQINAEIKALGDELRALADKQKSNTINSNKKMEKFSLLKTIGEIINNRQLNDAAIAVAEAGKAEMRKSGLNYTGQIQIPVEQRATIQATVAGQGEENVPEDKLNILEPLRARMVLTDAGATYMTGLVGNVSIPSYSGTNVAWKGEVADAEDGAGTFSEITLSPKRLTAYIDISKQFLNQDSNSAEEMLRRDIVNALADKLEATILGDAEGTTDMPAGIFNGAEATTISWENLVDMETKLEEKNVTGNYTFICSPAIKKALKTTSVTGGKSDIRMILDGGDVDGIKTLCTSNAKGIVLGNFNDYVIATFGALDLVVDGITQATKGCVRIIANIFVDAQPRRKEAFVAKTVA